MLGQDRGVAKCVRKFEFNPAAWAGCKQLKKWKKKGIHRRKSTLRQGRREAEGTVREYPVFLYYWRK